MQIIFSHFKICSKKRTSRNRTVLEADCRAYIVSLITHLPLFNDLEGGKVRRALAVEHELPLCRAASWHSEAVKEYLTCSTLEQFQRD